MITMKILTTPCEGVSDDRFRITNIHVENGQFVDSGQPIVSLETSKAVFDLEAPCSGFAYVRNKLGEDISRGSVVGVIASESIGTIIDYSSLDASIISPSHVKNDGQFLDNPKNEKPHCEGLKNDGNIRFSKRALKMVVSAGLGEDQFKSLGLVCESDVRHILEPIDNKAANPHSHMNKLKSSVIIVGGAGHTRMCIDLVQSMGCFEIEGIASSDAKVGMEVMGVRVVCKDLHEELILVREQGVEYAVNGVGAVDNHPIREAVFQRLTVAGFKFPVLIHKHAIVEPSAHIGPGTQVMAGAYVGSCVSVGCNCIVNAGAIVSHDCQIGNNVHLAPGSILGGGVRVGENTLIGMGCQILYGSLIGSSVIIANGVSVDGNVKDGEKRKHRTV